MQTDLHTFSTYGQNPTTDNCKCLLEKVNYVANYDGHFLTILTGVRFEDCKAGRIQHLGPVSPSPLLSTKRVLSDQRDVNQLSFISCFI